MKRVAIYIRVSTLDQARDGYSLAAQRKSLSKWVESNDYEIAHIYADEGISGKDIKHRPAMRQMIADVERRQIDIVLVWALSRLTRSVSDLYITWGTLQKYNVALVSYTEAFNTGTVSGRAMMGLLGVFAQMERELTGERVRAAMAERAAQGKRTCNEVLGYDLDGTDNLVINEAEAERVRYIYDSYIKYDNLSAVAELCRLRGYTGKRGKVFRAEHIKTILSRPIYIGYNSFCGKMYKGTHAPIISEVKYYRVQHMLEQPCKIGRKRLVTVYD